MFDFCFSRLNKENDTLSIYADLIQMQLPMIGAMEIDRGEQHTCTARTHTHVQRLPLLVYENGNHSSYQANEADDDECDSSAHARKIALDEDVLPRTTPTAADDDDDEPGRNACAPTRETERRKNNEY